MPNGLYPTYHGKYIIRPMVYSVHDLSNVLLSIHELGIRGFCSYQVGHEVIINGYIVR